MAEFPHLQITHKLDGTYKPPKRNFGEKKLPAQTKANLSDRLGHGQRLSDTLERIQSNWRSIKKEREQAGLPNLPDAVPVFLQIDPENLKVESLKSFGIEVLSVEEDGLIIGSSTDGDDFGKLKKKIQVFLNEQGQSKNQAAQLWNILSGEKWRVDYILSDDLKSKWHSIKDKNEYIVDVSIACDIPISDFPKKKPDESDNHYDLRLDKWRREKEGLEKKRDDQMEERNAALVRFIKPYAGEFLDGYIDSIDSFETRIKINGEGLKDLVINFPYLFDVTEYDPYTVKIEGGEEVELPPLSFSAPDGRAPAVCVIDSGVAEGHRYLKDAILPNKSHSYIENDPSTADVVEGGGHGTRVAGGVLFGNQIPQTGNHKHICWITSARVLENVSGEGRMPARLYPPALMERIVSDFPDIRIFNLSINANRPHRQKHMSAWANKLDSLTFENDILFVISAGNLTVNGNSSFYPGIADHLQSGKNYPDYFRERSSRISNPALSAFSLTVGSLAIDHYESKDHLSLTKKDEPSTFTRSGPGMWNMIKPDIAEYSGDYVKERTATPGQSPLFSTRGDTVSPTIRIPSGGSSAVARDQVGTSFSAPKVTRMAALILNEWPTASANFMRALIVHSARWPESYSSSFSYLDQLNLMGYGIPSEERILDNSPSRITFVAESKIQPKKAHIYTIKIPEELRRPGDSYEYRLEVTLAYKARSRRTRQGTKSYLSSWVDWISSKRIGESDEEFKERVAEYSAEDIDEPDDGEGEKAEVFQWFIREQSNWGEVKGIKRNDSTLQKDWLHLKSHDLPDHLSIAVVGHKGWEKDLLFEEAPYTLLVSIECLHPEVEVYEPIRIHNQIEVEATW